jgi:hypothetical protein
MNPVDLPKYQLIHQQFSDDCLACQAVKKCNKYHFSNPVHEIFQKTVVKVMALGVKVWIQKRYYHGASTKKLSNQQAVILQMVLNKKFNFSMDLELDEKKNSFYFNSECYNSRSFVHDLEHFYDSDMLLWKHTKNHKFCNVTFFCKGREELYAHSTLLSNKGYCEKLKFTDREDDYEITCPHSKKIMKKFLKCLYTDLPIKAQLTEFEKWELSQIAYRFNKYLADVPDVGIELIEYDW